ncbi:MAG: choice-of-anchor B family protein [Gammaproteobacteria bacterium]|nr:choice-of-anchor B family protein [Gammaproteobacteria bacterium]
MTRTACLLLLLLNATRLGAEPCVDGESAGFACHNVEFVAQLTPAELGASGERLSDIWGWTDPQTGEEYVVVGMFDGTAFVRIGSDGTPTFLGRLESTDGDSPVTKGAATEGKSCSDDCDAGAASTWRDVKVLGNYALVVSEASGYGMQVFDLTQLKDLSGPPADDFKASAYYAEIGHAHNVVVNEDYQRAYIVGSGSRSAGQGGLHIVNLSDPLNPSFFAEVNGDGYTHDAQCVAYAGPAADIPQDNDICFAANEDSLTIWDVTDPRQPELLSKSTYSQTAYTHQVWLSDDHRFAYLNDELDEQGFGSRTNTRIFDVSDPRNPVFIGEYLAPTWAIDHNNYVQGRFLYQSNYLAGLRILDIAEPDAPVEAAYFDVSASDATEFSGTWSNYPFFSSGFIALTDISQGLFIVKPVLDNSSSQADVVVTIDASASMNQDSTQPVTVTVSNVGGIALDDMLLTLHVPALPDISQLVEPVGWSCQPVGTRGSVAECRAGSMAAGETATFDLVLATGTDTAARFIASAYPSQVDVTPGDNRASVDVSLVAAAPAGNSGGGGGGISGAWLLAGLFVALRRRFAVS